MCTNLWCKLFLKLQLLVFVVGLWVTACAPAVAVTDPPVDSTRPVGEDGAQIEPPTLAVLATAVSSAEVTPTAVVATATPVPAQPTADTGTSVTFGPLSLVVPMGVADGATVSDSPRADGDDLAWWQKTPGHLQVMLGDYYVSQGQRHQPQIVVYSAQAYAELVPAAFESIRRLDNILYGSGGSISADQLPAVPFFNAQPVIATNIATLTFENGSGVRFLTQYGQANEPINNHDLFYQFQGVSRDGAYYIVAILPVTSAYLAETDDASAALPAGGIAAPDVADPRAEWDAYYAAVTDLLNGASPDELVPALALLDALIESIRLAP